MSNPIWSIPSFYREEEDDYIYSVNYSVILNEDGQTVEKKGTVPLRRPSHLIPFKELKQETVINWVKKRVDSFTIEKELREQINVNPSSNT